MAKNSNNHSNTVINILSTLHPDGASSKPSPNYKIITIKQTNQPPQKKNEKQNIHPSHKTK